VAFRGARGRNASAEVTLPTKQIERYWRADAASMVRTWDQAVGGGAQAGSISLQGNVANALAALFVACGQDIACVAEASTALTRMERTADGDLYASVTLPNLIVGTVGGGTYLPTARECLAMLGCAGAGHARKFAEVCAVVALAGELAVVGAMAGSNFATAHVSGSRRRRAAGEAESG
jgi:hydroxymethylglutaryl-CoA reductase (NADPH)